MKKTLTAVATTGLLLGASQVSANDLGAGFSWNGNLAVTSNYIFEGASETGGRPAIQGGFDLEHETGSVIRAMWMWMIPTPTTWSTGCSASA